MAKAFLISVILFLIIPGRNAKYDNYVLNAFIVICNKKEQLSLTQTTTSSSYNSTSALSFLGRIVTGNFDSWKLMLFIFL